MKKPQNFSQISKFWVQKIKRDFLGNKKAFLLGEHTLKIIIGVLCLVILFYLLFRLYLNQQESIKLEQAKASLDKVIEGIETAKKYGSFEMPLLKPGPYEWEILGITIREYWILKKTNNGLCICDEGRCDNEKKAACEIIKDNVLIDKEEIKVKKQQIEIINQKTQILIKEK